MNSSKSKHKKNLESACDYAAQQLMQADRDLYRLALYEKNIPRRRALIALWALITDIEKIPYQITEPQMGILRIKWWYDSITKDQADQTLLLVALNDALSQGFYNKDDLLALIDYMQGEITLHNHQDPAVLIDYIAEKGRFISKVLEYKDHATFIKITLLRGLHHYPHLWDNVTKSLQELTQAPTKEQDIYIKKSDYYAELLIKNIKKDKPIALSVLNLIKLHFC